MSSLDWLRLNVSIKTLQSDQGCFHSIVPRGGARFMSNGKKISYAVGDNGKNSPSFSIYDATEGECFNIEFYYFFDIKYIYSVKKINIQKEIE